MGAQCLANSVTETRHHQASLSPPVYVVLACRLEAICACLFQPQHYACKGHPRRRLPRRLAYFHLPFFFLFFPLVAVFGAYVPLPSRSFSLRPRPVCLLLPSRLAPARLLFRYAPFKRHSAPFNASSSREVSTVTSR